MTEPNANLDERILSFLKSGPAPFYVIDAAMKQENFRIVDRAMQRLRKAGKVRSIRQRWQLV